MIKVLLVFSLVIILGLLAAIVLAFIGCSEEDDHYHEN